MWDDGQALNQPWIVWSNWGADTTMHNLQGHTLLACQKMMSCALWLPPISLELTFHLHLGLTQLHQPSLFVLVSVCPNTMREVGKMSTCWSLTLLLSSSCSSQKPTSPGLGKKNSSLPYTRRGHWHSQWGTEWFRDTLYRLYSNLLCSMIQDWCIQHNKILDTQYRFTQAEAPCNPYSF